ncbi:hypothetical protein VTN02DRAFT_2427 [Thermoascus thermophilus]
MAAVRIEPAHGAQRERESQRDLCLRGRRRTEDGGRRIIVVCQTHLLASWRRRPGSMCSAIAVKRKKIPVYGEDGGGTLGCCGWPYPTAATGSAAKFTNKTLGATGAPCRRLGKAHPLHPAESRCFKGRHLSDLCNDREAREVGRAVLGAVKAAWEDAPGARKRPANDKLQQFTHDDASSTAEPCTTPPCHSTTTTMFRSLHCITAATY